VQDIRPAFRILRRSPVLTGTTVASIALSVGVTAVIFAAITSVLIAPLSYARPGELVLAQRVPPQMRVQSFRQRRFSIAIGCRTATDTDLSFHCGFLFCPQCDHRIDMRCTPRRQVGGHQSHNEQ
jgi:hypothetical protein